MRIAAIVCTAVVGLAGSSAWAACNWSTAKAEDVVASVTTPAPAPATPVQLPEADQQS